MQAEQEMPLQGGGQEMEIDLQDSNTQLRSEKPWQTLLNEQNASYLTGHLFLCQQNDPEISAPTKFHLVHASDLNKFLVLI